MEFLNTAASVMDGLKTLKKSGVLQLDDARGVHLNEARFVELFKTGTRTPHDSKWDEMYTEHNGIKYYCLTEKEDDMRSRIPALKEGERPVTVSRDWLEKKLEMCAGASFTQATMDKELKRLESLGAYTTEPQSADKIAIAVDTQFIHILARGGGKVAIERDSLGAFFDELFEIDAHVERGSP